MDFKADRLFDIEKSTLALEVKKIIVQVNEPSFMLEHEIFPRTRL